MVKDEELFITYIGEHYEDLKKKYRKFASLNKYEWDEDIFSDTIVKCYDTIQRNGKLADNSERGIENYFFLSLRNNLKREQQYSRVKNRVDASGDELKAALENHYGETSVTEKIKEDLYKDFAILYLMQKADQHFDAETMHCFQTKALYGLTYKELKEKTKIKGARTKALDVKKWLQENVTDCEVREAFNAIYGDLLE